MRVGGYSSSSFFFFFFEKKKKKKGDFNSTEKRKKTQKNIVSFFLSFFFIFCIRYFDISPIFFFSFSFSFLYAIPLRFHVHLFFFFLWHFLLFPLFPYPPFPNLTGVCVRCDTLQVPFLFKKKHLFIQLSLPFSLYLMCARYHFLDNSFHHFFFPSFSSALRPSVYGEAFCTFFSPPNFPKAA